MSSDRWEKIQELLGAALELEPTQRSGFLKEACGDDEVVCREVEALLEAHERAGSFLETPALGLAAQAQAAETPSRSLVGKALGAYQILSLLGSGGMGEVYKARDSKLNRSVAIKVLPPDKISDADRKRRFVQEARAASALNHPNVITIHDIGREDGIDFVVMEYVAGKTLDQLIPRRGLKLNEVLKYSIQIADALAKTHSAGIIHRDLKPGNVMVTDEGLVKVLDFGLAKLTERPKGTEDNRSATGTREVTEPGTVFGTVSYMSPEQAEGKGVDARSDIFSFGSLLYEMVTGQIAFQKDSMASTLAAILNQEPKPISKLVPGIRSELEKIIGRCLRKDRERRFQHMDDLKVALQELKDESDSGTLAGTGPARPASTGSALHPPTVARRTWVGLGAVFVLLAMAVGAWLFRGSSGKPQAAPEVIPLTTYAGSECSPSFSPDGNQVAFSWNGEKQDNYDIYVKLIGSSPPLRLTTDPAEDVSPAFSPDGRSIGFIRVAKDRWTFMTIPSMGGPERSVAEIPVVIGLGTDRPWFDGPLFAWFPDGKRVATYGLMLLSLETGETRSLTSPLPPSKLFTDSFPAVSPDGHTIAFGRSFISFVNASIYLLDVNQDLKPKAEPRQLTFSKDKNWSPTWTSNGQEIVFISSGESRIGSLRRVKASGQAEPQLLPFGGGEASWPAISRNGNRLAYQKNLFDTNIWRLPLSSSGTAAGPPAQVIASTRMDLTAQYSPDGKRIAFMSTRTGTWSIWVCDADGTNAVELLSQAGSPNWSPDGKRIAFDSNLEGNMDIYVVRASGGKPVRLTTDPADDNLPSWSRDGKWIYFTSLRSGRRQVWKAPAGGGEAVSVTKNGGFVAMESADGKSVFYTNRIDQAPMTAADMASMALWRIPVGGGEESQLLPSVDWRAFTPVNNGIYFIPEPGADGKHFIQFLNFAIGKVKMVAVIPHRPYLGLSVSPDEHSILYAQVDESSSDLMLVENFR
jgi:eukaryotic-like serine/threonine-protein kinase